MKKCQLKLKDFLPQEIKNTKAIKGGTGSGDDQGTQEIVGTEDITDG